MRNPNLLAGAILFALITAGCGSSTSSVKTSSDASGSSALFVRSIPPGAAIHIDGKPTGRVTPADVASFARSGECIVSLVLDGYHAWHGLARVNRDLAYTLEATLSPVSSGFGAISVQSDPPGASVTIDGQDRLYTAPTTIENVSASQHVVEYRLAGFYPFREEVVVSAGRTSASAPTLVRLGQGRITGRVIDEQGNGVVGAQVAIRNQDFSTTTSLFGIFLFPSVPQGTYTLEALLSSGSTPLRGRRQNVTVVAGESTNSADIVLSPGGAMGTINGRVTDSAGRPLDGAEVFASVAVVPGFLPDSTVAPQRASTDSSGRYTLEGLAAGFWVITAAYPGYATVTRGISPQIRLEANSSVTVDFELPKSSAPKPASPRRLGAMAFTFPAAMTRGSNAYEALRERLARRVWGDRYDGEAAMRFARHRSRTAPAGSLIEIDLSWSAPGDPDVIGYYIGRSPRESTGYQLIDDLLNPHAGLWIDYDQRLTAGNTYFYRVTAVNARGLHSEPSNTAQATPLGQIRAASQVSMTPSGAPVFSWETLSGAFAYDVQVFSSYPERFMEPLWEISSLPASSTSVVYGGSPLQSGQTYYWVVAGRNSADPGSITGWSLSRITPFTVP